MKREANTYQVNQDLVKRSGAAKWGLSASTTIFIIDL